MIGRAKIESLIPHKGGMCLLQAVEHWDDGGIRCTTETHRDPSNPLRHDGRLAAIHLVEYGAQAVAVHGGLLERARGSPGARPGLLVALRNVTFGAAHADDIAEPLTVTARRLVANAGGWLYAFQVSAGGKTLASGRVGILPAGGEALVSDRPG